MTCKREEEAREYLYIEARAFEGNDRKRPVQRYKNGPDNPDPDCWDSTRSVQNGYVMKYDETDKSGETPYLIVGRNGSGHVVDIDIDVDPEAHEEVFQGGVESLNHPDGALHFGSPNGGHTVLKTSEAHGFGDLGEATGIDFGGDIQGNSGLITSPFHHPDYTIRKVPETKIDFAPFLEDAVRLNYLFGGVVAENPSMKYPAVGNLSHGDRDGSPRGSSGEYDGPEWFTEDVARDALEEVPNNVGYEEFRNVGFALGDHFADDVALRLFREWYADSPRADAESDEWAQRIVKKANHNRGRKRTIGSIISIARSNGWDYDPSVYVPILPNPPAARSNLRTWGPLEPQISGENVGLTKSEARERTFETVRGAFSSGTNTLVEALPTLGKTYSAVEATADTDLPVSILTSRGNREQYAEIQEHAEELGLKSVVLPSVKRDCGCFAGDHGREVKQQVEDWYHRGASGKEIHMLYEEVFGNPIPCDGGEGDRCPYKAKWQFEAGEYDLLIGHYLHSHVQSVVSGRTVVFDEYPRETFETSLSGFLAPAVTTFLEGRPDIPYDGFAEVLEERGDDNRRKEALQAITDLESEGEVPIRFSDGHADGKAATYAMLATEEGGCGDDQYGNGRERANLPGTGGHGTAVYSPDDHRMLIRRTPHLEYARSVVGLDGTPRKRLWEDVQENKLTHTRVLSDAERRTYLRDTMNLRFVRTTEYMKSYNSEDHVYAREDGALLEGIKDRHNGSKAAVITTVTAESVHESVGLYSLNDENRLSRESNLVSSVGHYGDVHGSNRFKTERIGAVIGSNHFGDDYVKDRAAFLSVDVRRGDGKGRDLEYEEVGVEPGGVKHGIGTMIHEHMTADETLQAALRFGRDGKGATVYLHTAALPPVLSDLGVGEDGRVIKAYTDTEKAVLEALGEMDLEGTGGDDSSGGATTKEVAQADGVTVTRRQVRNVLSDLESRGFIQREERGGRNGLVWFDPAGELRNRAVHGHSAIPNECERECSLTADAGVNGKNSPSEISRIGIYTWNFRRTDSKEGEPAATTTNPGEAAAIADGPRVKPPD